MFSYHVYHKVIKSYYTVWKMPPKIPPFQSPVEEHFVHRFYRAGNFPWPLFLPNASKET